MASVIVLVQCNMVSSKCKINTQSIGGMNDSRQQKVIAFEMCTNVPRTDNREVSRIVREGIPKWRSDTAGTGKQEEPSVP